MENTSRHRQLTVLALAAMLVFLGIQAFFPGLFRWQSAELIPQENVTLIGRKDGRDVYKVRLNEPNDTATLYERNMYIVQVANSIAIPGVPFDNFFQEATSYYGYQYSPGAQNEKASRTSLALTERFPGLFFASLGARNIDNNADHALANFEAAHSVQFRSTNVPETGVHGGPGGLYVVILLQDSAVIRVPVRDVPVDCGNSVIDQGEECDDGNSNTNDDCTNYCTTSVCGDGICAADEVPTPSCNLDVGACTGSFEPGACFADCVFNQSSSSSAPGEFCGNGVLNEGEQCDDGNTTLWDGCNNQCQTQTCDMCPPNADCNCVGGSTSSVSGGSCETEAECGLAPGMPNTSCPDGSFSGPYCTKVQEGGCAWLIRQCPASLSSSSASSVSSSSDACTQQECGPAPSLPTGCPDVVFALPVCGRNASGVCAWSTLDCPASSSSSVAAVCGDGVCSGAEYGSPFCTPSIEAPDACNNFCPQDCSTGPS